MRVAGAIAAMFHRVLKRTKSLRPEAVFATVPEQPRAVSTTDDGHGASGSDANTPCHCKSVLKLNPGVMACRARHRLVFAQARVVEQAFAKFRCSARTFDSVGRVLWLRWQLTQMHRGQNADVGSVPSVPVCDGLVRGTASEYVGDRHCSKHEDSEADRYRS